ncbi:MAG TPA: M55 family metallopeptidase [Fimbriimonas sp.]|nr:M55 family metallopeptidase [Fimbriimonas sp.]
MKCFISADIEGITGLVSWSQCGRADGDHYDFPFARRMMTHDVNAAVRGARAAGADEIVIKDAHGNSKSLLIDELEPGVRLVSGQGAGTDGMMMGIDGSFDAALLVGYHGMAGSMGGIMEHTITGGIHRLTVNGRPCGEMGLSAGVAGRFGVPIVFVSSDVVGCLEAQELIPGVATAAVKEGIGRYMGKMRHPSETGPMIQSQVEKAVRARAQVKPFTWDEPCTIRVEFNRAEEADMGAKVPRVDRVDGYTLEVSRPTFQEAHQVLWVLVALSFQGIQSQQ